jgi:hypothetical protein
MPHPAPLAARLACAAEEEGLVRISFLCLAVAVIALASGARAHTTVKAQAAEGVRDDNALRIGHGCEENAVVAQSVVFPGDAPELRSSNPAVMIGDLGEVIAPASIAGLVGAIQDRSIFLAQGEKTDALGNVVGFFGRLGHLAPELAGRVPFQFSAPNFVPESCAVRLRIEIAIADICKLTKPALQPEKVNLWIPDNGSTFASEGATNGVEGIGGPAVLTVNRNLTANPLPAACGAGYDVFVTPSAQQIDRDLAIPGWPPTRAKSR